MERRSSRDVFSTSEGHALVRRILRQHLPYDPHDYQLEGICHVLDGHDLLAVIATGSAKTGLYSMYMLMLIELSKNPSICDPPVKDIPKNPVMVAIYPTIGLEEQMAEAFMSVKLPSIVINSNTLDEARKSGRNLWHAARTGYAVILLSPEQLVSKGFESLLQ